MCEAGTGEMNVSSPAYSTLLSPPGSTSAMGSWGCWTTSTGLTLCLSRPRPTRDT